VFQLGFQKGRVLVLKKGSLVRCWITAEVERVFSQVKLVKCDHINRMKQVTMNNIVHVKLNCNKQCYEHVSDTVVAIKSNKVYNEILTFNIYT
jgi:hypothetical protein